MELLQLRYFRSAAEFENFSKAGAIHMVPQSAISKTIHKLEAELECELFDRKGKKVYLNENGRRFLKRVDTALNSIDSGVKELSASRIRLLRIYIQAGIKFVPDLVSSFHQEYPNYRIVFFQGKSDQLLGSEYDLTLMQLPVPIDEFNYQILMEDEIYLAVHAASRLARKKEISIKSLKNENFISFCKNNQLRILSDRLCMESGFAPHIICEAEEAAVFRSMLEADAGLALVPGRSWNMARTEAVRLIPLKERPQRTLIIAWRKSRILTEELQAFIIHARSWFLKI